MRSRTAPGATREDPATPEADDWVTHRLGAFIATLSDLSSVEAIVEAAVAGAIGAVGADAGALVGRSGTAAETGFSAAAYDPSELREMASRAPERIDLNGSGPCELVAVPVEDEDLEFLLLARRDRPFTREESVLLAVGSRILTQSMKMVRTVEAERRQRRALEQKSRENEVLLSSLRERQRLLMRLSRIQSSIVSRHEIGEVLDGIVRGAAELIDDDLTALRLLDEDDPERTVIVASSGISRKELRRSRHGRIGEGAGGRAISEERLVVVESYGDDPTAVRGWVRNGIGSAMAAPVSERGHVVGSLVVASRDSARTYTTAEREILDLFAKHASLALTDARNVDDAMHQALHDSLTGLPNRDLLLDRLAQGLARAKRSGASVGVLFLDLDSFKTINDSLGHAAGDEMLVSVAKRLLACVRPGDTAARFGGDEFAILIEDVSTIDVGFFARRVLATLEAPIKLRGQEFLISASIGIATGQDPDEDLLRNADLAMYRAKRSGPGNFVVFQQEMHASIVRRQELEGDLKRAINAEALDVHYQPIIELRSGRIASLEALVRWTHPTRGPLSPGEFVPLAEETGAILTLGSLVLRRACAAVAELRRADPAADLRLSVNVSIVQLEQPRLVHELSEILRETGLDPAALTLELTETALMRDAEGMRIRLEQLSRLGVSLAVDDFGTGYSSLRHMQIFPIDTLKIAKPFIEGVGGAGDDSSLARAIMDIGHSLDLDVVAEGIERPEQLSRLIELGCGFGQGFHIARPMALEDLAGRLAAQRADLIDGR